MKAGDFSLRRLTFSFFKQCSGLGMVGGASGKQADHCRSEEALRDDTARSRGEKFSKYSALPFRLPLPMYTHPDASRDAAIVLWYNCALRRWVIQVVAIGEFRVIRCAAQAVGSKVQSAKSSAPNAELDYPAVVRNAVRKIRLQQSSAVNAGLRLRHRLATPSPKHRRSNRETSLASGDT
jgi:hypothetical protein